MPRLGMHNATAQKIWIAGLTTLTLVVVGSVLYAIRRAAEANDPSAIVQESPTGQTSPTPELPVETIPEPSSSPAVQPSATATATETPRSNTETATLPDSARAVLANFYAAYKDKDRERLETFFTPDTTDELRSLRSRLFKGIDPQGNPGGPTLFATNSASQVATNYRILGSAAQDANWIVTLEEDRVGGTGEEIADEVTLITMVRASSDQTKWLIDMYSHVRSSGKYDGFLLE